jgi:hypothetical protein
MRLNLHAKLPITNCLFVLPFITSAIAFANSDVIALSSGTASPGTSVSLALTLTSSGGTPPSAVEWTFSYSASDFTSVSVSIAGTAVAAGKVADCAAGASGRYTCLIYGMNSTAIADGKIATATFTVSASTSNSTSVINVVNASSSSGSGGAIAITGQSGSVTISHGSGVSMKSLTCSPSSVQTPGSTTCTLTLTGPAPSGGFTATIGFSTQSGAQVSVPGAITVPMNATSANFSGQIGSVSSNSSITFTTTGGHASLSSTVTLLAASERTISGAVSPASLGAGATITLSGAGKATTTANAAGKYTFVGLANGTYVITPSATGMIFSPPTRTVTVAGANVTSVDFTASSAPTFTLSGSISPSSIGSGTLLQLQGKGTVSADAHGNYKFTGLPNGTYTVTPQKAGYTFTPNSATVKINGANVSSVNFTASPGLRRDVLVHADQGSASSSVKSPAFSTPSGNELLLAFIGADSVKTPNTSVTSVTGGGLTWQLVGRTNTQRGTAEIWRAFASKPLVSVTVTANLSQSVVSSLTVLAYNGVSTSGKNGSGAIGAIASANASSGAPSASLKTTHDNAVVIGVGNDYDHAIPRTPGPNQWLIHQDLAPVGDTYWVQRHTLTPLKGTVVTINDTAPTGDRYNLFICEIILAN